MQLEPFSLTKKFARTLNDLENDMRLSNEMRVENVSVITHVLIAMHPNMW